MSIVDELESARREWYAALDEIENGLKRLEGLWDYDETQELVRLLIETKKRIQRLIEYLGLHIRDDFEGLKEEK